MKPLLYLEYRLFVNSIKNTLRSPVRLIPALLVAAFVIAWIMQTAILLASAPRPNMLVWKTLGPALHLEGLVQSATFLLLSFGTVVILFHAFSTGSLIFSLAHIDFLFPTPIPRRSVLLLKLFRDYLRYTLWIVLFVVFTGAPAMQALGGSLYPYGFVSVAALAAYLLFVLNVTHTVNIVFTFGFERFKQLSVIVKSLLILVAASAVIVGIWHFAWTGSADFSLRDAAASPIIRTVFAPAHWCSSLILSPFTAMNAEKVRFDQLILLWLLAAGSFFMLISRKENIYEPSLGVSVKAARMKQAMISGDSTAIRVQNLQEKGTTRSKLLLIRPFGKGATALLWKNLLMRYRMSWGQLLLLVVLPIGVIFAVSRVDAVEILQNLPFILIYLSFLMSITVQPQIRAELKHANILKAMPISAYKVMLMQILTGTIYLASGTLAFAISMWALVPAARTDLLPACTIASIFLGFPCVAATSIPALLYPDSRDQAQNFFCNIMGMALIAVALAPTVVLGVVLGVLLEMSAYTVIAPVCVVNFIVGMAAVAVAGAIFQKLNPGSE